MIYAGSGEGLQRPDLAVGDGIYKSIDGGATWTHLGLRDGQQIASMAVDPGDANRLFVAVLGHPYGPNAERGIYRSLDGGATFQRVLYRERKHRRLRRRARPERPEDRVRDAVGRAPGALGDRRFVRDSRAAGSSSRPTAARRGRKLRAGLAGPHRPRRDRRRAQQLQRRLRVRRRRGEGRRCGRALSQRRRRRAFCPRQRCRRNRAARRRPRLARRRPARCADRLSHQHVDLPLDRRRQNADRDQRRAGRRRLSHGLGQSARPTNHRARERPRRNDLGRRRRDVELLVQSADRADVSTSTPTNAFRIGSAAASRRAARRACAAAATGAKPRERDWHPVGRAGVRLRRSRSAALTASFSAERSRSFDERTGQTQEVSPIALPSKQYRTVRTEPLAFDPLRPAAALLRSERRLRDAKTAARAGARSAPISRARIPAPTVPPDRSARSNATIRSAATIAASSTRSRRRTCAPERSGREPTTGYVWITRDRRSARWKQHHAAGLTPWSKVAQIDASRFDDETAFVAVNRFRLDDLRPYVYVTRDGGATWRLAVDGLPQPAGQRRAARSRRAAAALRGNGERRLRLVRCGQRSGNRCSSIFRTRRCAISSSTATTSIVATHGRGFWILDDVEPLRELAACRLDSSGQRRAPLRARARLSRAAQHEHRHAAAAGRAARRESARRRDRRLRAARAGAARRHLDLRRAGRDWFGDTPATTPPPPPIPHLDKPAYWERPFRATLDRRGHAPLRLGSARAAAASRSTRICRYRRCRTTRRACRRARSSFRARYTVRLDVDGTTLQQPLDVAMDPRVTISQRALDAAIPRSRRASSPTR